MITISGNRGEVVVQIEKLCEEYGMDDIVNTLSKNGARYAEIESFFQRIIDQAGKCSFIPLQILLSYAVFKGNPVFEKLPQVMQNAKEELQNPLKEHLERTTRLEFGSEASKWLRQNYARIDEGTFAMCWAIKWGLIKPEY